MKKLIILTMLVSTFSSFAGNITVKGSDTMIILGQKWAEVYMKNNPSVKIQVTGGGSGTGFAALQNKQTDIANASRKIKTKEVEGCIKTFGKRPKEYTVALDGLSVYVNVKNKINNITMEEVQDVFTGKITNWKQLGGEDKRIIVYSRENSSGTYEFFKEHVLHGKDFSADVQTLAGTAQLIQSISMDEQSIGYGGAAYSRGVKQISIAVEKGGEYIAPTEQNILSGKYPIWRYLYIYLNPDLDNGDVKSYLDWIRSDEGQSIVKNIGYYPLKK
jgi:phosphate transport system substrate-binding protein